MIGWWIISAKKEERRMARLAKLISVGKISRPAVLELLKTRDGNIDNQRENDRVESKRKNALGQSEATHAA